MSKKKKPRATGRGDPRKSRAQKGGASDAQSLLGNAELQDSMRRGDSSDSDKGWLSFIGTALSNLEVDGLVERYLEASQIEELIASGVQPEELGLDPKDYRLQNVAQMSEVARDVEGDVDQPAAHSLRDANFWFYTFFANNGGSFEGMDMERYREIGAMPGEQAAEHLPAFEADTFERSGDAATREFGESLPEENRRELFMMHNRLLSPGRGKKD